jgi:cardiolipin synthase
MLGLIDKAENYIIINTFLILNDSSGNIILEALRKKHNSGVAVYVMADSSSRFLEGESGFSYMDRNLIPFAEYNAIRPWKLFPPINFIKLRFRDHRKYWIVDGKYVLLGGSNIMNSSLQSQDTGGHTDGMALIESPEVAEQLIFSFINNWNEYSSSDIRSADFNIPETAQMDTTVVLFNQEVKDKKPVIEFMVNRLFAAAEKEVWIIQPYTFINDKIIFYVEEMEKRGIEVNIVLSRVANHEKYHYASFYGIKDLIDVGADVWIYDYKESPLHFKAYIIDDRFFSIGSSNFNKRSMELSAEVNILFSDRKSFDILYRSLDEIKRNLRKVTSEEAMEYRSLEYKRWHLIMQNAG